MSKASSRGVREKVFAPEPTETNQKLDRSLRVKIGVYGAGDSEPWLLAVECRHGTAESVAEYCERHLDARVQQIAAEYDMVAVLVPYRSLEQLEARPEVLRIGLAKGMTLA
jgi:hypothetical protein